MKRSTTEEFKTKLLIKRGAEYDYSLVDYSGTHSLIKIICKHHGIFEQLAYKHMNGHGCKECAKLSTKKILSLTQDAVIHEFEKIHNGFYDYSTVIYINNITKVSIRCPLHGIFEITPKMHKKGQGCKKCGIDRKTTEVEQFKIQAIAQHGVKWNYDKISYVNNHTKIVIGCPKHGDFLQRPNAHLKGAGCKVCSLTERSFTNTLFIEKAKKITEGFFDYSKVNYINNDIKVTIICPLHGEFKQTPANHLNGQRCPRCQDSKGELKISRILKENEVNFVQQYRIPDCKFKKPLPFDFAVFANDRLMGLIEFNGAQHYYPIDKFGGEKTHQQVKLRDSIKAKYCQEHKIPLLIIEYNKNKEIDILVTKFTKSVGALKCQVK